MSYVKLTGLPKLYFAHIYGAEGYVNELPACENKIEISYVSEGRMCGVKGDMSYTNEKYDVSCNLYLTGVVLVEGGTFILGVIIRIYKSRKQFVCGSYALLGVK